MTNTGRKIITAALTPLLVAAILSFARTTATTFGVLSTVGLMPHRMCLLGVPILIWVDAVSNQIVAICYLIIPALLVRVFLRGILIQPSDTNKISHATVLLPWFAAFIICCGMSHQMDVITLWVPYYYMDAAIRILTAIASVGTCIVLAQKLPVLMGIASTADLMTQVQLLTAQVAKLAKAATAISEPKDIPV